MDIIQNRFYPFHSYWLKRWLKRRCRQALRFESMDPNPHTELGELEYSSRFAYPDAAGRRRLSERLIQDFSLGVHRPRVNAVAVIDVEHDNVGNKHARHVLDRPFLLALNFIDPGRRRVFRVLRHTSGNRIFGEDLIAFVQKDGLGCQIDLDP